MLDAGYWLLDASNRCQRKPSVGGLIRRTRTPEMGDAVPQNPRRTAMQVFVSAGVGLVGLALLPVVVVALILLEALLFGSRHFSNGLEAIGLTKVLEAIFNALGMNG